MDHHALDPILNDAIEARRTMLDPLHASAVRLFNGFAEGCSDLVIDLYGETVVFHNYADPPERGESIVRLAEETVRAALPWLQSGLTKTRAGTSAQRRGELAFGRSLTDRIREGDIWYAIDLTMHQDCSLYLDTRNLRKWAFEHLRKKSVLNAFAYTGGLGLAALAGGAERVIQLDRTGRFLDLAQASYTLNGFAVHQRDFVCADFFREAGRLRRQRESFDCIFLDPPFFSVSPAGTVDQEHHSARLINKVRPLVKPGGILVAINNALYVSGAAYMQVLESQCRDGHLEITELIPVPQDFIGLSPLRHSAPITDPAPFNHSTKIAVLRIRRQPSRAAREESGASRSGS